MNRVLDRLWIGAGRDFAYPLAALGFVAVLDLRDATTPSADVPTHRLVGRDGDPWKREEVVEAIAFVYDGVRRGRVLVVCDAGMSRSASMVTGFLVRCGWDAPSALACVKAVRSVAAPKAVMLEAVLRAVRGEA